MLFHKLNSLKDYGKHSNNDNHINLSRFDFSFLREKPEGHIKKSIVEELVKEPEYNVTFYKEEKNLVSLQEKYTDNFYLIPLNKIGEVILLKLYINYKLIDSYKEKNYLKIPIASINREEVHKYFFNYEKIAHFSSFKRNRSASIFTKMEIFYNRKLYKELKKFIKVIEKYYLLNTLDIKHILFLGDNLYKYEGVSTLIPKEMYSRIKFSPLPENNDNFCCEVCKRDLEVDIDNWLINGEEDSRISYRCTKCNHSSLAENIVYFQKKFSFFNSFVQLALTPDSYKERMGEYYEISR